jgi:mitochondrial fission protein ELM1
MEKRQPHIRVLLGARAGDNAQALELARQLGGPVTPTPLAFNALSGLPNWLLGAGVKTLTGEAAATLDAPWPDIVVATGRRTAPVNLAIKEASGGRSLAIQLGRPRMPLARFDLVLTTAQYGLPQDDNVVMLDFPFAVARQVPEATLARFRERWSHLPRPWIVGVIGAAKFPIGFGSAEIEGFAYAVDALARRHNGSVILMDSPRSVPGAIAAVAHRISVPRWHWTRGDGDNPYQAALRLADRLAVTSDSVSMVAEMVQSGTPTAVYHLPVSPLVPSWNAGAGLAGHLARSGLISPPRSVTAYLSRLMAKGWVGNLNTGSEPVQAFTPDGGHEAAVQRILTLWGSRATG